MPLTSTELDWLRLNHPHSITPYASIFNPQTIWTGSVSGAPLKGDTLLSVITDYGNLSNCDAGMTVRVYSDTQVYKGKRRLRATGTNTITIDENGVDWVVGDELVIVDDYELWSILPKIDVVGDIITFYKDGDIVYTDENMYPSPVAIIHGERFYIIDEFPAQLTWYGADSYAIATGATITNYQWVLRNGLSNFGTVIGSSTANTFTVEVSAYASDGLWLELTVTDSNGNTQITRRPVFIHARTGAYAPFTDFTLKSVSGNWDTGGWKCSLVIHRLISLIQRDAHIILWHESTYGILESGAALNDRRQYIYGDSGVIIDGRVYQEDPEYSLDGMLHTTITLHDIVEQLRHKRMFSISLEYTASPTTWYEYYNLTVFRAIHHLYKHHSTLLEITNLIISTTSLMNTALLSAIDDFTSGDMYSICDTFIRNHGLFAHICANKGGSIYVQIEYNMLSDADRANVLHAMTITEADMTGDPAVKFSRKVGARAWLVEASGVHFDGTTSTPYMSSAPGTSPEASGNVELQLERLVIDGQTYLNEVSGRACSVVNNEIERLVLKLAGNYTFIDIAPQSTYYIELSALQTGRIGGYSGYIIPRDISMQYNADGGSVAIVVEFETEAPSLLGSSVPVPPPPDPPSPPDPPDPPIYPPPPDIIPGTGFGSVYLLINGKLYRTRLLSDTSPTWTNISPISVTGLNDYILSPWNPYSTGVLLGDDGVYISDNLDTESVTWTQVITQAEVQTLVTEADNTVIDFYKVIGSINMQDYYGFIGRWDRPDINSPGGLFYVYTFDAGVTWNYSIIANAAMYPGERGRYSQRGAIDIVPHTIGTEHTLYAAALGSGTFPYPSQHHLFRSDDTGLTWTRIYTVAANGSSPLGPVMVHCPYDGNESGNSVYWSVLKDNNANYFFHTTSVGTTSLVAGLPNSAYYNTKRWTGETHTFDNQRMYHWHNTELWTSDDGGSTWDVVPTTGLPTGSGTPILSSGGFPYNNDLFYVVMGDGAGNVVVYVSLDRGLTWVDKTGNLSEALGTYNTYRNVIVPLWLAE